MQQVDVHHQVTKLQSFDELREAVARLRRGEAACVRNISAELVKAVVVVIRGLLAVVTDVWQSVPNPDWKRRLIIPVWKGKGDRHD